jgi:hypothetical protein
MKKYAQIDGSNRVFSVVESGQEIIGADIVPVPEGVFPLGMVWDGAAFVPYQKTEKETALDELAEIDRKTGMTRMMRETLIAIAGEKVPAALTAEEAKAVTARNKLK